MPPFIHFQNIGVSYPLATGGSQDVFRSLDLTLAEGDFVTIVGPTGCGKSTLLRLLLGSERPASGMVTMDGSVISHPSRDRGYVPQKYSLFPDKTVLRNVMFGPLAERSWWQRRAAVRDEALTILERVGISERDAAKFPHQLSGGMQQRVAIAQSLIMQPRVLLMDESFSALDPATRSGMQRLLRSIWAESRTTVLFVTHNLAEAIFLGQRVVALARRGEHGPSQIAVDLPVPGYLRHPDGTLPRSEEDSLVRQLHPAAEELIETAG